MRCALWVSCLLIVASPVRAQDSPPPSDSAAVSDSAWWDAPALDSSAVDSAALAQPPRGGPDYLAEMRAAYTPQTRVYAGLKGALRLIEALYLVLAGLVVLFSGLAAKLRDIAHNIGRRRWVRVLVFLTLYSVLLSAVTFPVEWFDGFVIEHRFGLSNQTFVAWLGDQGKAAMLSLVFLDVLPILWMVYTLLARSPRWWWLWLGMAALPLTAAVVLLQAVLVG